MRRMYALVATDEGREAVDVTRSVGEPVQLRRAQATAAVLDGNGCLAVSLLQLTKRAADQLGAKPLQFPMGPLRRLQRVTNLQRPQAGTLTVMIEGVVATVPYSIDSAGAVLLSPPLEPEYEELEHTSGSLRLTVIGPPEALGGVVFSCTGFFGKPGSTLRIAQVLKRALELLLDVPEATDRLGFSSVGLSAGTRDTAGGLDSASFRLFGRKDDDISDLTELVGSDAIAQESPACVMATCETPRALAALLVADESGIRSLLEAASLGTPATGVSNLLRSLQRQHDAREGEDDDVVRVRVTISTGAEEHQGSIRLRLVGDVQVDGLSPEQRARRFTQLDGPTRVTLLLSPPGSRNVGISLAARFGAPGTGHSMQRLILFALREGLRVPGVSEALRVSADLGIGVPAASSRSRGLVASTPVTEQESVELVDSTVKELLATSVASAPQDVSLLADLLHKLPTTGARIGSELRILRVDDAGLRAHPDSERVRALLLLEHLVERAAEDADGSEASIRAFAAAATAHQAATLRRYERTNWATRSRLVHLVDEFLSMAYQRPWSPRPELTAGHYPASRLGALLAAAPWLSFLFKASPDLPLVALDARHVVQALALAQPQYTCRGTKAFMSLQQRSVKSTDVTSRFTIHTRSPLELEAHPGYVNDLCNVLADLYNSPGLVVRRAQRLARYPEMLYAVERAAEQYAATVMGSTSDVRLLTDVSGGMRTFTFINVAETRRVLVEVRGLPPVPAADVDRQQVLPPVGGLEQQHLLRELAVVEENAFGYTSPVLSLPAASVVETTVGEDVARWQPVERARLRAVGSAATEWIDAQLFRGRDRELQRILTLAEPGLPVRQPAVIYGTRRAGKTTLAVHACRSGVEQGKLSAFAVIDIANTPNSAEEDGYLQRLARELSDIASIDFGVPDIESDDPVRVLRLLDRKCQAEGRVVALVLDEFDTLLARDEDSPLRVLAGRLGSLAWRNLLLVLTVQRFSSKSAELKSATMVECGPDLDWRSGVTYFCGPLVEPSSLAAQHPVDGPVLLPSIFRDCVWPRLGARPYFWGQLMSRLENHAVARPDSSRFAERDLVSSLIDDMLREDTFLALPLTDDSGLPLEERRRKDLFTLGEKRILAQWATSRRDMVDVKSATTTGGGEAVTELLERQYLRRSTSSETTLELAVPLFGEWLRLHQHDFLPLVDRKVEAVVG